MGVWISCKPSDHVCLVACYLLKNQMRWSLHDKDLASLDAIGFTSSIKTQMAITLTSTNKLHLCEWMSNEYLLVNNSVDSTYWLSKSRSSHIQYPLQALHTGLIDIDCTSHHLHSQFSQMQDTSKSSHWCQKHPTVVLLRVPITVDLQVCDDFGESLEAQVRYFLFWGGQSAANTKVCKFWVDWKSFKQKKHSEKIRDSIFQRFICLSGTSRMPLASYAETPQPQQPMWSRFSCLSINTSGHCYVSHSLSGQLPCTYPYGLRSCPFCLRAVRREFLTRVVSYQEVGIYIIVRISSSTFVWSGGWLGGCSNKSLVFARVDACSTEGLVPHRGTSNRFNYVARIRGRIMELSIRLIKRTPTPKLDQH